MPRSRAIGDRLRRASTPAVRATVARDWAVNWREEQAFLLARLDEALARSDVQGAREMARQLRAISAKRFSALPRVLASLIEAPDR